MVALKTLRMMALLILAMAFGTAMLGDDKKTVGDLHVIAQFASGLVLLGATYLWNVYGEWERASPGERGGLKAIFVLIGTEVGAAVVALSCVYESSGYSFDSIPTPL